MLQGSLVAESPRTDCRYDAIFLNREGLYS